MKEYIVLEDERGYEKTLGELIRCKDCVYYSPLRKGSKAGTCPLSKWVVNGEHYCSWAERKEE